MDYWPLRQFEGQEGSEVLAGPVGARPTGLHQVCSGTNIAQVEADSGCGLLLCELTHHC